MRPHRTVDGVDGERTVSDQRIYPWERFYALARKAGAFQPRDPVSEGAVACDAASPTPSHRTRSMAQRLWTKVRKGAARAREPTLTGHQSPAVRRETLHRLVYARRGSGYREA